MYNHVFVLWRALAHTAETGAWKMISPESQSHTKIVHLVLSTRAAAAQKVLKTGTWVVSPCDMFSNVDKEITQNGYTGCKPLN